MMHAATNATSDDLTQRLRKIAGQVRGVQHMIERGEPCIDVLTQISAARAALAAVALGLLDGQLRHALADGHVDADRAAVDTMAAVELLIR